MGALKFLKEGLCISSLQRFGLNFGPNTYINIIFFKLLIYYYLKIIINILYSENEDQGSQNNHNYDSYFN